MAVPRDGRWLCDVSLRICHEAKLYTRTAHHRVEYATDSSRSASHRRLRSSFFLSWGDWEAAGERVIGIRPVGAHYTSRGRSESKAFVQLQELLRSKSCLHPRAHSLRRECTMVLVELGLYEGAEKWAELELLLSMRRGPILASSHQQTGSRCTETSALALYNIVRVARLKLEPGDPIHWSRCNPRDAQGWADLRTLMQVFQGVSRWSFNLHAKSNDDRQRSLQWTETRARCGFALGDWRLALSQLEALLQQQEAELGARASKTLTTTMRLGRAYFAADPDIYSADAEPCLQRAFRCGIETARAPLVQVLRALGEWTQAHRLAAESGANLRSGSGSEASEKK